MDLNDFLGPKPIVVNLWAENRWEAIDELLDHLAAHQKIKCPCLICDNVWPK